MTTVTNPRQTTSRIQNFALGRHSTAASGRRPLGQSTVRATDANLRGQLRANAATVSPQPSKIESTAKRMYWPENFHERYDLGRELGRGSHGIVRVCIDKTTGLSYAAKIVPKHQSQNQPENGGPTLRTLPLSKIKQEAQFLRTLQGCPYVVRHKGCYEDREWAYIVQELCLGGSLAGCLKERGHFKETEAARALFCVFTVLAACHKNNILYGDIKLANFIVAHSISDDDNKFDGVPHSYLPWIKAIDLGCSSVCPQGWSRTRVKGTPLYAAPEAFMKRFDKAADMWGVGLVMYQLLSGHLPFWGKTSGLGMFELMEGTLGGDILWRPEEIWDNVSPEARDLISRLLERDPTARITANEALAHPWMTMNIPCGPACLL